MSIILTSSELTEITGFKTARAQVRSLVDLGIPHRVRRDGKPIVSRDVWISTMSGHGIPRASRTDQPNFEALTDA